MDLPRLYAILDVDVLSTRGLGAIAVVDAWLTAGIRLIQLRAKTLESGPFLELADQVHVRIQQARGHFIINDRADIARMSAADGVHVGQTDLAPGDVRAVIGDRMLVGLSTHTEAQLAAGATQAVSYLAMGPVFPTRTKGEKVDAVVGVEGVRAASRKLAGSLPLVAIGGITLERAPEVLAAGAASVAVITDLLAESPEARARTFLSALA